MQATVAAFTATALGVLNTHETDRCGDVVQQIRG